MSRPLVGVVMAVYNCEKYVKESLQSIFNQSFKDFELFITMDGCKDKTEEIILDTLKDFNGKYHLVKENINRGCADARMRCINLSKNVYIAIQDADDISFPDRLEKEVKFLEENKYIFCVGAWANKIEENGDFVDIMDYPPASNEDICNEIITKKNNPIIDPSCMYRRKIFNKLRGYDNRWKLVPDFNLWARAAKAGYKFANLQEVLVLYRQHPNSVTNKSEMDVVKEHFKMCRELL